MKVSKGANKSNAVVGVYCCPLSQEEGAFQRQIEDLSKKHEAVVRWNFNYPDVCWEITMPSMSFQEIPGLSC